MVAEPKVHRHPWQQAKVAAMQSDRDRRANEQRGNYSFRLTSVAGYGVVFITSHTPDKLGNCPIYSVSGTRCNCPDFVHRCSKVAGLTCKHVRLAQDWLAGCSTPELPEPAACSTVTCAGCGDEKPGRSCPSCGSTRVVPAAAFATVDLPQLTPEDAAHADRRARYRADVAAGLWG